MAGRYGRAMTEQTKQELTLNVLSLRYSSWSMRAFLALQQAAMAATGEWTPIDAPATAEELLMSFS